MNVVVAADCATVSETSGKPLAGGAEQLLLRAVGEKAALRVSAVLGEEQQPFNARLVQVAKDGTGALWVNPVDVPRELMELLTKQQPECQVSFCVRQNRYTFDTGILKRDKYFWLNDQMMIDALQLRAPANLREVQQRRSARHPISDGCGVTGDLFRYVERWHQGKLKQQPVAVKARLRDLSLHGAGFISAFDRVLTELKPGDRMGCVVHHQGKRIALLATLRQIRIVSSRAIHVGISFVLPAAGAGDPAHEDPNEVLARITKELQRQQALRDQVRGRVAS